MLEKIDFTSEPLTKEAYKPVHDELVNKLVMLQQEARTAGLGLVVLVEGLSGAGKGSRISELVYELDARATRVYVGKCIDPKTARKFKGIEWGVMAETPLMKQFWQPLGERGDMTFYDCGWYTTAAEQVLFGLAEANAKALKKHAKKAKKPSESERAALKVRTQLQGDFMRGFPQMAENLEQALIDDGYIVVKLFVHISKKAQKKRLEALRDNPDTAWRVSKRKLAMTQYYDLACEVYDKLLESTNFDCAPWTIVNGEDRRRANIEIARTLVEALERGLNALNAKKQESSIEAISTTPDDLQPKDFEELAAAQSSLAPRMTRYPIVSDYPQIDHTKEKPRIDDETEYRTLLKAEQARFRKLQEESYTKRVPLMIMYEGWDAAGKGGNIKRVAQAIDARSYRIYPSPAPTAVELAHPHLWRYWTRMPDAGLVGIYDRSWYGRVLVERVEGFARPDEWARAYDEINAFEQELVQWGAILLKFWVDITPDEQLARFEARAADPGKTWKLTDEDWRNREKYPLYKAAADDMFRLTSTSFAPWIVLDSDNKWYARIQALQAINAALEARLHR